MSRLLAAGSLLCLAGQPTLAQAAAPAPLVLERVDAPQGAGQLHFRLVRRLSPPRAGDVPAINAARHLAAFQHQVGILVRCGGQPAGRTNLFGEFTCPAPVAGGRLSVAAGGQTWLVAAPTWPSAQHITVSDIDDTALLWEPPGQRIWQNVVSQNGLTRRLYPDFAALLAGVGGRGGTTVYLSNSPRTLLPELELLLRRSDLPAPDAFFLRPLQLPGEQHKARVLNYLAEHSAATFTLIGDDVSRDPEIYRAFAERWPGRVKQIIIRRVR